MAFLTEVLHLLSQSSFFLLGYMEFVCNRLFFFTRLGSQAIFILLHRFAPEAGDGWLSVGFSTSKQGNPAKDLQ